MATTAFVVGFFTAMGWWSANKFIQIVIEKPVITIEQKNIEKGNKDDGTN